MAYELHKVGVRASLRPRREPYWGPPLERSRYLGFRKLADGTGTWIARMLDEHGDHKYRSLGQVTDAHGYDWATDAAEAWFKDQDAGVTNDRPATVTDACKDYVEALRDDGRDSTAHDIEKRFERLVYDDPIGKIRLDKLRTARLREWRNAIPGTPDTQNRNWAVMRAALNLAVTNRKVNAAATVEWRSVRQHKNAKRRRELFLDVKQRRKLLGACKGALRDLVEASMLTAARPGELVNAKRSQFDARTQKMTFTGKTGTRSVPLSPAAVTLFTRLAKGKLPTAPLLPADDGKPWPHSGWDEGIKLAVKKGKLPSGTVLYTLRHSAITEMLRAGMSTLDVARLVGTSLPMLEKNYGHLVADSARERLAQVTML
jgi:integrase